MSSVNIVCIVTLLCLTCVVATIPHSCRDVARTNRTDGEYIIYLRQNVGVLIYCSGLSTNSPKEYLTLRAGRSNNVASYYQYYGSVDSCGLAYPSRIYQRWGRTEYTRIRLHLDTLSVDISDYTFTHQLGPNKICYGCAGDHFSQSTNCVPNGMFKISLSLTPFVVSPNVQWQWSGNYSKPSAPGHAFVDYTYKVGCFIDASIRLLPSAYWRSSHMTPTLCIKHCKQKRYRFAGVEFGVECYCGYSHDRYAMASHPSECNSHCVSLQGCGGSWRISVYFTGPDQNLQGRCGGFPGSCFPALKTAPTVPALQLALLSSHACLRGQCKNEASCIALSDKRFKCLCHSGYTGPLCDQMSTTYLTVQGDSCPQGSQPYECSCGSPCTGAKFQRDVCLASNSAPMTACRRGDPGFVVLFNQNSASGQPVSCPKGSDIVGCTYWDSKGHHRGNGTGKILSSVCTIAGCSTCTIQARCRKYMCGCLNGGSCSKVTGTCYCPLGYFGSKCEMFDYCSFYEDHHNTSACPAGTCLAVPERAVHTYGGDNDGDHCIFPFTMNGLTFSSCISSNQVGPPFACGAKFDGVNDYIDLMSWNPGAVYTIAVWLFPTISDGTRRTIIGGIQDCQDFGLSMQNGRFQAYYYPAQSAKCSSSLQAPAYYTKGKWYLLAVANNGTDLFIYINRQMVASAKVKPYYLLSTKTFFIGKSACCRGEAFKGTIKSVKIWKRCLGVNEVTSAMSVSDSSNSTVEARYNGLVAHFEFGQGVRVPCMGIDHGGDIWRVKNQEILSGSHCNVSQFYVPQGVGAFIQSYNGTSGGLFEVYAENILVDGFIDGRGSGYRGGATPTLPGQGGIQGDSINGAGQRLTSSNKGGGGGGAGGTSRSRGYGRPGGGGGFGSQGGAPSKRSMSGGGWGVGGGTYGDVRLSKPYLGSGGGSGGNALNLQNNPKGGKGGNGGGSIVLYSTGKVTITGFVSVMGEDGQGDASSSFSCSGCPQACRASSPSQCTGSSTSACWDMSGPGGGGSGGSIYITGTVVDVGVHTLRAHGGMGGVGAMGGCGGDGGKGRVQINAVVVKGSIDPIQGIVHRADASQQYIDYSIPGQRLINPAQTVVGNEVDRGCFSDSSSRRTLGHAVSLTSQQSAKMTPTFCITLCRQKGFAFSGVEAGSRCFCDNHLDSSRQISYSACSQHCRGDSHQICGSTVSLSVHGPRPLVPAEGHGPSSRCTPWCVTADATSPQPKWGFCDLSTQRTMSWKILCECPPGYWGSCDQPCTNNTWGMNCQNQCTCNMNNTVNCNTVDGQCNCKAGYTGVNCNSQCPNGTFGDNCRGKCSCLETSMCDPRNGDCVCRPGWKGERCNIPCSPGWYGANCTQKCPCTEHGSCSPQDGTCNCDTGYKLQFCAEMCDRGNYGPNCQLDCDCNGQDCDPRTGVCLCGPGLKGDKCEQNCPRGTWGQGCSKSCNCQQGAGCDGTGGNCQCPPGYAGLQCQFPCNNWKFGANCLQSCTCVQGNTARCDPTVGRCNCKPGYRGRNCSLPCLTGFYGQGCQQKCPCKGGVPCDPASGRCHCLPGFTGAVCDIPCPNGKYGVGCSQTCHACSSGVCSKADGACICKSGPCTCPQGFWGSTCITMCNCVHGMCDSHKGSCVCLAGWKGTNCNTSCSQGTYGKNCASNCLCVDAPCDPADGSCSCTDGNTGADCSLKCKNGTYGPNCQLPCPNCGSRSVGCDPVTGICLCSTGYSGLSCDQPCPTGTYGDNCRQQCRCVRGSCDTVTGRCDCPPGYNGTTCDTPCSTGTWGINCENRCDCGSHSVGCESTMGICHCKRGFQGLKCQQSCYQGYYGDKCLSSCACAMSNSQCSPLDGSCECFPGYYGQNCTKRCMLGKWGHGCQQDCECSDHGICNPTDGSCDCAPGYTGAHCTTACKQDVFWGKNCATLCNCNGQYCDHVTGSCDCPPGRVGSHCQQACDGSHFGLQCAQKCQCQNGAACDLVSGTCHCTEGWTGDSCDQKCPIGRFGLGCTLTCNCAHDASCEALTGVCQCTPGFMGTNCSQGCPSGQWGAGCQLTCPSSCPGNCLADTGVCKCQTVPCSNGGSCRPDGRCQCMYGWIGDDCNTAYGRDQYHADNNIHFSLSGGQVAGIVIGFLAVLVLSVLGVGLFMKRRMNMQSVPPVSFSGSEVQITSSKEAVGFSNPILDSPEFMFSGHVDEDHTDA